MSTTRAFGDTGMNLTPLGLGTWVMAGAGWEYSWGATEDADSIAAIRHAVSSGLNWLDTAPAYGLGHAEELVGRALADIPESDRPYIFTKTGLIWGEGDDRSGPPRRVMRPEIVRAELENSLRRLRVDHIDLYQVHWPDTGAIFVYGEEGRAGEHATPLEEYWQLMADLKKEGKVRAIGLSNHDLAQLATAESIAHVDAIQPPFSAINRSAAPEIAWARDNGTGVIVYSPLQSGLLTGAFTAERARTLGADDWRAAHADFTTGLTANLALVEALRPIAARHGVTVAEVALAWATSWSGVTGAITGARTAAQIDGWIGASSLRLTDQDLAEVAAALTATGAGTGPIRP
ncbi:aldo/keto reductase [Nocardia cyriacigeorgica]|uniref:Aldo/keto reductase n=2 Tax=Nocardia cyriacigeorgica TaxID=135487 RepID=A0A6P1CIR6_9NOCA|nr:aldo/keto reductase [Nocardia cyriacigeorgica]MBF6084212.1 aldo/keto reductase [Nocardia cyriacigeorgica]MBF6286829.1 aldo/keto reductase [Nocardia cyriacigeorgica]MBF6426660.1 aldo/keto reductase [Nocardia cyriacigeorgica]NEW32308.1 aldo/keto reductase [Nocardia cyriacigeorgica]CCF62783.1 putative aldo/keto reductase [Nocardia cyriacigeorgica GUH-2]